MEIIENKVGEVNVLGPCGRLDTNAAVEFEQKLNGLTDAEPVWLVVNMDKLEYISSSGLRALLAALKKSRQKQGDIRLACLQPFVKEVFDIAGFSQLFKMFDKEEDALNSFK
jgi:anti-sigma B factor antagonist